MVLRVLVSIVLDTAEPNREAHGKSHSMEPLHPPRTSAVHASRSFAASYTLAFLLISYFVFCYSLVFENPHI